MDKQAIVDMIRVAKAPVVICETPWPGIAEDMSWLRAHL
jgi:hypothetical protein